MPLVSICIGAYFHKSFIRGKRHLFVGVDKHKFMKEMPGFLAVDDEPDLYEIAEKEAEEERKRLGNKPPPPAPSGESLKDSGRKEGGPRGSSKASMLKTNKAVKTQNSSKSKMERKKFVGGDKVVPTRRKERRKFEDFDNPFAYKSRLDPVHTKGVEPSKRGKTGEMSPASRRMSKMQFLQSIPLCQYYVPALQQSPRPYSMPPILRDAIELDDQSRACLLFGDTNGLSPPGQNQKTAKKRKLSSSSTRKNEQPSKLAKTIANGGDATPRGVTMRESGKWVSCRQVFDHLCVLTLGYQKRCRFERYLLVSLSCCCL